MANYTLSQTGSEVQDLLNGIGDLSDLDTTAKSDLVSAINEVVGQLPLSVQYANATAGATVSFTTKDSHNIGVIVYKRGNDYGVYLMTYWDATLTELHNNGTAMNFTKSANSFTVSIKNNLASALAILFIS